MSKTHSVLEPMDIVVIYAHATHKEKRFRVFPKLADEVVKVLDESKRFWEWEKTIETQAAMIRAFQQRTDYYKLLEKYMRHIDACESFTYVGDEWCGDLGSKYYTKEEHAVLLELRDKIEKEIP